MADCIGLHGAAEGDPALELLGDVLGHQLGVGFRLADLDDVQVNLAVRHGRQVLAQLVDVRALLADDHAGACGIDGDAALLVRSLDDDPRHAGLVQALLQRTTDLDVLVQQTAVLLAIGEPTGVPGAVDAEAKPDRIDLLTH
jgi:hypothetical protein